MKNRFWKKTAAGIMALLIVAGTTPVTPFSSPVKMVAVTASAEGEITSGKCGENATWCFDPDTGKLTISGIGAMYNYYVTHPWNGYKDDITSVEIENGITSIGILAFYDCTSFTSIEIPDSVESIGNGAFQRCTSLKSIVIPAKVTNIGADAFYDCTNITDVYCYANPEDLTWNEGGSDDFIRSETGKPTICHVPAEYLDDYNTKFGTESESPVNVTFVGDVDMGLGEHLCGHSITLDGGIGVNFYVELTDELLESKTAEMVFTVPNGSKTDTQTLLVKTLSQTRVTVSSSAARPTTSSSAVSPQGYGFRDHRTAH